MFYVSDGRFVSSFYTWKYSVLKKNCWWNRKFQGFVKFSHPFFRNKNVLVNQTQDMGKVADVNSSVRPTDFGWYTSLVSFLSYECNWKSITFPSVSYPHCRLFIWQNTNICRKVNVVRPSVARPISFEWSSKLFCTFSSMDAIALYCFI